MKDSRKLKVLAVVGARPNFMKIAPIMHEFGRSADLFEMRLVHTGQHYDENMSDVFFNDLNIPRPDVNLEVGSDSHARQTAQIMERFEAVLSDYKPEWIIVPGDVNSTLACALTASKMGVNVAHVEAGLRSYDRSMPEEINRVLTDQISDLLLTPSRDANENLLREGIAPERVHFVGNLMIDTLCDLLPRAQEKWKSLQSRMGLDDAYILVTLHRPSNVDDLPTLREIVNALISTAGETTVIFPVHPRTRHKIAALRLPDVEKHLKLVEPLGYLDFLALEANASVVLTDSGGIQEETTYLKVPCLTVRPNTERPVTITCGTNRLIQGTTDAISRAIVEAFRNRCRCDYAVPELWDGHTAERIGDIFRKVAL